MRKDEYDYIFGDEDDCEEETEKLRGTIASGDCLCCGGKNTMRYEDNICFICSKCGASVHEDIYYRWAAGYPVEVEPEYGEEYGDVYDKDGDEVVCDICGHEIKCKDGEYLCPNCGQTFTYEEFLNYIGETDI